MFTNLNPSQCVCTEANVKEINITLRPYMKNLIALPAIPTFCYDLSTTEFLPDECTWENLFIKSNTNPNDIIVMESDNGNFTVPPLGIYQINLTDWNGVRFFISGTEEITKCWNSR